MKIFCILSDERAFLSRSPAIFAAVLQRVGLKGTYVPFRVAPEELGQALESLRVLNIDGANVTVPYKEAVVPYLDVLSEGANIIGAINTIVRSGRQLKGYNTNAVGFMDALMEIGFDVAGKSALVVGTGGAARAVVFILNWLRASTVWLAGRNPETTGRLVQRFGGQALPLGELADRPLPVQILINATSVSGPEEAPELAALIDRLEMPGCELVVDLNYGRRRSMWQDWALGHRVRFMDGLPILAHQARRTFALWTGIQVPPGEFLSVIRGN